jgi:hypothetical protein
VAGDARLQEESQSGDIVLSAEIASDPATSDHRNRPN